MSHLRPDLLPGLLRAAARNQARGFMDLGLFEVGSAFPGGEPGEQTLMAAGIRVGHTGPRDSHGARRPVDFFDARADAEATLAAIAAPTSMPPLREAPGWFHPGRSAALRLGRNPLAVFGEIHPRVLRDLDLRGPAVGFAVWLDHAPRRSAAAPPGPPSRSRTSRPSSATSPSSSTPPSRPKPSSRPPAAPTRR
jgi:phenylalanyl-tRNA synthetase beta chain